MPFTTDEFYDVFRTYNQAVWPGQIALVVAALLAVYLALRPGARSSRVIAAVLAFFWFWMGVVYHFAFFADVNPAARLFGVVFLIQGMLFVWAGGLRRTLSFQMRSDVYGWLGGAFAVYAIVLYPLLGWLVGHRYPAVPTFGVPCPTVVFTFALLLWTSGRVPIILLVIPLLWVIVGASAVVLFGVVQDTGLVMAGLLGTALIVARNRTRIGNSRRRLQAFPNNPTLPERLS